MRRRSEDIHVWPALTDLMCGITLVVVLMLVKSTIVTEQGQAHFKEERVHLQAELARLQAERARLQDELHKAQDIIQRESQRVGVKRELLDDLRARLVAKHVKVKPIKDSPAGSLVIPADVLFAMGEDAVDPATVEPLGRGLRELLLSEKGRNVRYVLVIGHTDDVGDRASNLELSLRRARNLVATWNQNLLGGSLAGSEELCATKKLIPSGMGKMSPAVDAWHCDNEPGELGCRANRRIEIQIVPKEADEADPCERRPRP
jgi:outer membrane protein OmpA-like peptidoglycan-associated protein